MFHSPLLLNPTLHSSGDAGTWATAEQFSQMVASNTGNMAFLHAILAIIEHIEPVSRRSFAQADVKVWGCANFIAPNREVTVAPSPLYDDGKPIVALGLGAQASLSGAFFKIPTNTVQWIKKIRALSPTRAPNITLRGQYTYDLLKEYGLADGCIPLGCPSLFIAPYKDLGDRIRSKSQSSPKFIGCAPGNPESNAPKCIEVEQWLVRTLSERGGSYLVQHPLPMLRILKSDSRSQEPDSVDGIRSKLLPNYSNDEFIHWVRSHGRIFHDVPSWLFHNAALDFVVSMRIHGAQLALQAGTPALCIAIDMRQIELCEIMKVPYMLMSEFRADLTVEELYERVQKHDWSAFDENRNALARRTVEFLDSNGLVASRHLQSLAR